MGLVSTAEKFRRLVRVASRNTLKDIAFIEVRIPENAEIRPASAPRPNAARRELMASYPKELIDECERKLISRIRLAGCSSSPVEEQGR